MALIQWKQIDPDLRDSGRLSGSLYLTGSQFVTGDLTVGGKVTAQEYYTELISASILFESGSSKFGDSFDDTHIFTGSVNITGSFSINGIDFDSLAGGLITSINSGDGLLGGGSTGDITLSLDTGSAHFTEALAAINYAGIFKQTGSIYATTNDLEVTGSLTLNYDGSTDPLRVTSGSKDVFSVSGEGVLKLISQSGTPNPIEGGIYYGNDGNFYFGS
jgi:hypothetical protein